MPCRIDYLEELTGFGDSDSGSHAPARSLAPGTQEATPPLLFPFVGFFCFLHLEAQTVVIDLKYSLKTQARCYR